MHSVGEMQSYWLLRRVVYCLRVLKVKPGLQFKLIALLEWVSSNVIY